MSIIHDALKKVQSNRSETQTSPKEKISLAPPPLPAREVRVNAAVAHLASPSNKPGFSNTALWGSLVFVLAGVTFYNLYEYSVRTTEMAKTKFYAATVQPFTVERDKPVAPAPAATAQTSTPAVPIPKPPQPKKGEIILSGIVVMDGKNFALVNNEFYETGETVEGAKITKITADTIDIFKNGETQTIKVLRPK